MARGQTGAAGTSTKPKAVDAGVASAAWWAVQRCVNSSPLPCHRVATRAREHGVVKAMACSHREWGMDSAGVVRVRRQWSHRPATWVRWCAAWAGGLVFIGASKCGVYMETL